ncbi:MAG: GIY-YIG nuclease family protein [Ignavibacteria bacterium]|nr:GIY-YIG nuclease family protein [Ignavibacteria bacterium]
MFFTYILISLSTEKIYIGHTENLDRRLEEHNSLNRKSSYTSKRGPWKLIFKKEFETKSEASKFEAYLKSLKNKKYILEKFCDGIR